MAREQILHDITLIASVDLSSSQYCAVAPDTTAAGSKAALPSAGAKILGVVQNKPISGASADIRVLGMTKMLVGSSAGVTAGDPIKVDTTGAAVTATSGTYQVGWALETAAASTICTVELLPMGKQ